MRDGILLRADILRPKGVGPFPVLVYRTPYGKHFAQKEYTIFHRAVQRGYAVVIQDVRGRYASGGEFRPYENEGRDGYDTIEWAAKQEWSNGNVGTFGLSYPVSRRATRLPLKKTYSSVLLPPTPLSARGSLPIPVQ